MVWWQICILSIILLVESIHAFRFRILNGQDADIEDFPYQVSIRYDGRHFCGGSIISKRHIITAGHCFREMNPPYAKQTVVTGTSHNSIGGQVHQISEITLHPDFHANINRAVNDVAVVTLKDDIVFDKYQQKINLPEHDYTVGQRVNLTGWGRTQQFPAVRPKHLQQLETNLISVEECQQKVVDPEATKIYDTEVCTKGVESSGTCTGDSGGPLAANGELIGIVSWSDGEYCGSGVPDVYANVYKYLDFINIVMIH